VTPERYRQVNALTDVALQMRPDQRGAFLNEACGSDIELRKQIEALIVGDSASGNFLKKPLLEVLAGDLLARPAQRELVGRRIENYEVLSRLGAGGIGEVWLARDLKLDREIALKLLAPKFAGDPYHVRHFQQEARAASALNHPNIITVYEIGETDGAMFIAEERVTGETIREQLARGPIALRQTLDIGMQIAAALGAAHAAGVVHRDIKPENAMVRLDGLVKVLDFGLARFVERPVNRSGTALESGSLPGLVLGTVRYMSPEQARGLPVDNRSDLFSLGVMLYEMAAGMPPFSGTTPTDTIAAILTSDPAPLSRYMRDVPAEFEHIVRRCMAKDPAARYASAEDLKAELTQLAGRLARRAAPLKPWFIVAAASAILGALATGYLLMNRKEPLEASFNSMQFTRLTTHGDALDAALSHNGKLLAYIASDESGQSLWIKNAAESSETAIVPAEPGQHSGVTFSTDDTFVYYRLRNAEGIGDLYRVSVNGGMPKRIVGGVSSAAALSPDGRHIAFVRLDPGNWEDSLIVSTADGGSAVTLATRRRPQYFDEHSVTWSPDSRYIACFAGEGARYSESASHLVEVRLADGRQRAMSPQLWAWPRSVAWSAKGDVLVVTAATRGDDIFQLWTVRANSGAVNRLTNDLNNYDHVTLADDGNSLITVESETSAGIWIGAGGDPTRFVPIGATPLRSRNISVAWTPDGRIVYSNPTGDYRNLSLMDTDGRNRKLLTSGDGNKDQIVMSRDGRYIVYKRNGNIWRMDADGTHANPLTHGALDVHPDVSADGRSVIYASFKDWSPAIGAEPSLWRIPIDGGHAVEVSPQPTSYPRESPDGRRLGCIYFPGKDPRLSADQLAVLALDGSKAFTIFESSPSEDTPIAWSPGAKALDYVVNVRGVGNIWRQPLTGAPSTPVTRFEAEELFAFAWSTGGRLACVRGTTVRSVLLIKNFR
jgi:serine/threonine protein kinase